MNRKYSVPILDQVHYFIQIAAGQIVGFASYILLYGIVQVIEHEKFMNSSAKVYEPSPFVVALTYLLNVICYLLVPLVIQALFMKSKAEDQFENTDDPLRWLKKGAIYMVPPTIVFAAAAVFVTGFVFPISQPMVWIGQTVMRVTNILAVNIILVLSGWLLYWGCHTAVLLAVYRHFWMAWGRSKDEGKLRMSEDAYGSYEPKN